MLLYEQTTKFLLYLSSLKLKTQSRQIEGSSGETEIMFTMQGWARRAAGETWNRATATSLLRRQFLFNLFQPSTFLETAHAIHYSWWHVSTNTRLATIRVDGENMGSTSEGTDHNPATVMAEADVLNLGTR